MSTRGWSSLTFAGMVLAIMAQASNMVALKKAMSGRTDKFVLAFYCNFLSAFLLLPSLLLLRRRNSRPLTPSLLLKFFLLSLIGFVSQMFGYIGINYSSPTLGTALMNLIPAFTFILAIVFRMEKLAWKSLRSQAKVVGTVTSIAGAFIVTFYKGPPLIASTNSASSGWILGGFFLAGEALLTSLLFIAQAFILVDYPVVLVIIFFKNLFEIVFAAVLSLVAVRDPKSWVLKADSGLLAVVYSAVVGNAFRITVVTWCIKRRGPVYVAMFKPLGVIFAVMLGAVFLGDTLCRGSLIGAIIIVGGFYVVMWGKSKDEDKANSGPNGLPQTSEKTPLLAPEQG